MRRVMSWLSRMSDAISDRFAGDRPVHVETLRGELSLPGSPYRVAYRLLHLPETQCRPNHYSYGLSRARNGDLLVGIGNNVDDALVFRFDPQRETFSELGSFKQALPAELIERGSFGKVHAPPYDDGEGTIWISSMPAKKDHPNTSGRLFTWDSSGFRDIGAVPNDTGVYFVAADEDRRQLYVATSDGHFRIFDLQKRTWRDKGRFTSKAPMTGLTDRQGRLYLFGYDGDGEWAPGPATITLYDPESDELETSRNAPPTLWVGALTPDGASAYTSTFEQARLFRWRFDDWPDIRAEALGTIDPLGRSVFSNNMSLTPDGSGLVIAGTINSRFPGLMAREHGIWLRELESGRTFQIARLNGLMRESMGNAGQRVIYWNNVNTRDDEGWIWLGVHTMPPDHTSVPRLLGIRITKVADA